MIALSRSSASRAPARDDRPRKTIVCPTPARGSFEGVTAPCTSVRHFAARRPFHVRAVRVNSLRAVKLAYFPGMAAGLPYPRHMQTSQRAAIAPTAVPSLDGLYSEHVNPQWVKLLNILQMNVQYEHCSAC